MTRICAYLMILITLAALSTPAFAQPRTDDTLVTHILANVIVTPPNVIECDILVKNLSDSWRLWANGTFSIAVSGANLLKASINIDSTALPREDDRPAPALQRRNGYTLQTRLNAERSQIALAVIGPDDAARCVALKQGDSLLVARLRITLAESIMNPSMTKLLWLVPLERKQKSAFKTDRALNDPTTRSYATNDNVAMMIRFATAPTEVFQPPQTTLLDSLRATYIGDQRIRLEWKALSRYAGVRAGDLNAGFVLRRGARGLYDADNANVRFADTVADFRRHSALRVATLAPQGYTRIDTVAKRNETYVYELSFYDASKHPATTMLTAAALDTADAMTKNAVISAAWASPNPASTQTLLEYFLEDRVTVSAVLYDLQGKRLRTLMDAIEQARGQYSTAFDVTALGRGFYSIVLTAYPTNDPSVELSRAVVKLQISQ